MAGIKIHSKTIAGIFAFAALWSVAAFGATILLMEAEGPPGGPINAAPLLLRMGCQILIFPILQIWQSFDIDFGFVGIFLMGVFWAALFIGITRLAKRFVSRQTS